MRSMPVTDSKNNYSHLVRLPCNDLIVGMFVSEIDCSWASTPFPVGGFHLRNTEELQVLQKYCRLVTIDTTRGAAPAPKKRANLTILSTARLATPPAAAIKVNRDAYPVTQPVKKQIDKAYRGYQDTAIIYDSFTDAVHNDQRLNLRELEAPMLSLIECAIANPQTLIWILLTDTKVTGENLYCVRAAIWATILGRQVGLGQKELEDLFKGTLLADIGMHLLPERLTSIRGNFRKKEYLAYRKHVNFSIELLSQYRELDERLLRLVRCHHERHDGRGFPRGLRGDQIPALARFTILAYSFERLLRSNNPLGRVSPAKATARLYKQRELKFPEQLIVEFIHVLGMNPVGSVVQLSTGEIALVLEQNVADRLHPKIAIIKDDNGMSLAKPRIEDLTETPKSGIPKAIVSSVNPGQLEIDLGQYTFAFAGRRVALGKFGFRL